MSTPVSGAPSSASTPSASPSPSSAPSTSSAPSSNSVVPKGVDASAGAKPNAGGGDPGAKHLGGNAPSQSATEVPQAAEQQAAKEAARKLKLKINGKEVEWDESEVIRKAQLAGAADEKFQEASQLRKQAEQFWEMLLKNPKDVLLHPELRDRINFRQLAEEYLGSELKRELMSPEERELQELREYKQKQVEQAENAQREHMTKSQQQEMQRLQQRAAQEYESKIVESLQQSGLPKTPHTVKRIAELLHGALAKGYELDVPTAVDMVRQGYQTDVQALIGNLDGEQLIKVLGDDLTKKIRKYDLQRIKAQLEPQAAQASEQASAPNAAPRRSQETSQTLRPDEWKEMIRKRAGF